MSVRDEPCYRSTFIAVAEDCPAAQAKVPEKAGSVAEIEFRLIAGRPFGLTQADVLWEVHRARGGAGTREEFFAKPMACLRASPLGKTYGWGLRFDAEGRIGLVPRESEEYDRDRSDPALAQTRAMRNRRA